MTDKEYTEIAARKEQADLIRYKIARVQADITFLQNQKNEAAFQITFRNETTKEEVRITDKESQSVHLHESIKRKQAELVTLESQYEAL